MILPSRANDGSDLLGGAGDDPPRLAAGRDRPSRCRSCRRRAGSRRRRSGARRRARRASRRPDRRASAAAGRRRRAGRRRGSSERLPRLLADEGDAAPVGRPVGLGVGRRCRRDRAVADVEVAVARGDDELREPACGDASPSHDKAGKQRQRRERRCDQEKPSSARHALRMLPDRSGRQAGSLAERLPRPPRASRPARRRRPRRRRAAATPSSERVGEDRRRARRRAPPAPPDRAGARRAPDGRSARRAGRRTSARARRRSATGRRRSRRSGSRRGRR